MTESLAYVESFVFSAKASAPTQRLLAAYADDCWAV
jgi:hypothetical protein